MDIIFGVIIFLLSSVLLYVAGEFLVTGLLRLSRYYRVTEFVVAFFVMAFAASIPNLLVGVSSALQGVPELSFGDIMGNNMIALTLAVACGILWAPGRVLPIEGKIMQDTTFLTLIAAILPLVLISDGTISRSDGTVLVMLFIGYIYWLVRERERFKKPFAEARTSLTRQQAMVSTVYVVLGVTILAIAAQGIVYGATLLAVGVGLPLVLIGLLVIGFGGALPEVYFTILAARRGETNMIAGNLMGAVIIPATFVLGIVALIEPIHNNTLELALLPRLLLAAAAIIFFYAAQSRQAISAREAWLLLGIYGLFLWSMIHSALLV